MWVSVNRHVHVVITCLQKTILHNFKAKEYQASSETGHFCSKRKLVLKIKEIQDHKHLQCLLRFLKQLKQPTCLIFLAFWDFCICRKFS